MSVRSRVSLARHNATLIDLPTSPRLRRSDRGSERADEHVHRAVPAYGSERVRSDALPQRLVRIELDDPAGEVVGGRAHEQLAPVLPADLIGDERCRDAREAKGRSFIELDRHPCRVAGRDDEGAGARVPRTEVVDRTHAPDLA